MRISIVASLSLFVPAALVAWSACSSSDENAATKGRKDSGAVGLDGEVIIDPEEDAGMLVGGECDPAGVFNAPHLVMGLPNDIATPVLTADEKTIFFQYGADNFDDIHMATRESDVATFGTSSIAIDYSDGGIPIADGGTLTPTTPAISGDGLRLYVTPTEELPLHVFVRAAAASPFGSPTPLSTLSNTARHPIALKDDRALYFVDDAPTAAGGCTDDPDAGDACVGALFRATRNGATFETPTRVTSLALNLFRAAITDDELTLFYTPLQGSNLSTGIFVSKRAATTEEFAPGTLLTGGASGGETSRTRVAWVSPNGCRLYSYSERGTTDAGKVFRLYVLEKSGGAP